jgi:hypothetical protein
VDITEAQLTEFVAAQEIDCVSNEHGRIAYNVGRGQFDVYDRTRLLYSFDDADSAAAEYNALGD